MDKGIFDPNDFSDVANNDGTVTLDTAPSSEITDDEKKKVIECWNSGATDLKTIIESVCGAGADGRNKKAMAVKKYLAEQNLKARPANVYVKRKDAIVLTESNKEFIANNAAAMKPLEITRLLFNDANLSPLSSEFRIVKQYYDGLDLKVKAQTTDENTKDYNPPKIETQALARINKYVFEAIDPTKITPRHRECIQKLIRFMHTHRYLFEMNNLPRNSERELFESSFVRFVYDKPDLTEEEIDLYLNQCSDIVGYQRMQKELVKLTEARDTSIDEDGKIPMALVEAIGKLRSNMDDNFKRQKTTLNDLNGKRANRLEKINSNNESVLKLIEAFRDEVQRSLILKVMENRQKEVKDEVKRLESIEDLHVHLFGLDKSEV